MSELKYDPELPFAVVIEYYPGGYVILGRCSTRQLAEDLLRNGTILRKIIDTTPKPKIPEDAEFILVETEDVAKDIYQRVEDKHEDSGFYWYRAIDSMAYGHEELLGMIGDAELTVLVRKEET